MGGLGDRVGNRRAMAVGFSLIVVALSWLQVAGDTWTFYLFALVFGIGFGAFAALQSPIAAELFGLGAHGAIFGCLNLFPSAGGALGPVLVGSIFDVTGSYQEAFLVCLASGVIALILALSLRPARREHAEKG